MIVKFAELLKLLLTVPLFIMISATNAEPAAARKNVEESRADFILLLPFDFSVSQEFIFLKDAEQSNVDPVRNFAFSIEPSGLTQS